MLVFLEHMGKLQRRMLVLSQWGCVALDPELILFGEPCGALDPIASSVVEVCVDRQQFENTTHPITGSFIDGTRC